jgi:hypothetical protein
MIPVPLSSLCVTNACAGNYCFSFMTHIIQPLSKINYSTRSIESSRRHSLLLIATRSQ